MSHPGSSHAGGFHQLFDLLERLEGLPLGLPVDQLDHSLQVATRAWRARAQPDLVLGALMHDVGRLIRPEAHGRASAELIRPFVSDSVYWIVRIHDELGLQFVPPEPGLRSTAGLYAAEPWFPAARVFAEQWDRYSFATDAAALPLAFFRPLLTDACLDRGRAAAAGAP
ncbi:MAG: HD domain-containing protein [Phenylobacterium sp.]